MEVVSHPQLHLQDRAEDHQEEWSQESHQRDNNNEYITQIKDH